MTDNTDTMAPVWSAVRALLITLGTALAANGYGDSHIYKIVEFASGSVLIVGPAAWGVWTAFRNREQKKEITTTAVNAGMNLAASGQMRTTPEGIPVPATAESAKKIVQNFG